ncbi:putative deoxyribonuclease TATDN2 [Trichonephila clavipes]|uniref:Putative deoxyribonuclease TATDN2 n=1 Tax=Trichonephila clavipes TaxID=2585209 RepID=A0A8X6V523_TRICX|nr:putative deoxyribonuclease TATDN2 [Trichonephila clavipes]
MFSRATVSTPLYPTVVRVPWIDHPLARSSQLAAYWLDANVFLIHIKTASGLKSLFRPLKVILKFNTLCAKCRSDSNFATLPVPDVIETQLGIKESMTKPIVPANNDLLEEVELTTELKVHDKYSLDKMKVMNKNKSKRNFLMSVSSKYEHESRLPLAHDQSVLDFDECGLSIHQRTVNEYYDELSLNLDQLPREENDCILLLRKSTANEHNQKLSLILDKVTRDENDYKFVLILSKSADKYDKSDNLISNLKDYTLPIDLENSSTNTIDGKFFLNKVIADGNFYISSLNFDKSIVHRNVWDLHLNQSTVVKGDFKLPLALNKSTENRNYRLLLAFNNVKLCTNYFRIPLSLNKSIIETNNYKSLWDLNKPIRGVHKLHFTLNKPTNGNCCLSPLDKYIVNEANCQSPLDKPAADKDDYRSTLDKIEDKKDHKLHSNLNTSLPLNRCRDSQSSLILNRTVSDVKVKSNYELPLNPDKHMVNIKSKLPLVPNYSENSKSEAISALTFFQLQSSFSCKKRFTSDSNTSTSNSVLPSSGNAYWGAKSLDTSQSSPSNFTENLKNSSNSDSVGKISKHEKDVNFFEKSTIFSPQRIEEKSFTASKLHDCSSTSSNDRINFLKKCNVSVRDDSSITSKKNGNICNDTHKCESWSEAAILKNSSTFQSNSQDQFIGKEHEMLNIQTNIHKPQNEFLEKARKMVPAAEKKGISFKSLVSLMDFCMSYSEKENPDSNYNKRKNCARKIEMIVEPYESGGVFERDIQQENRLPNYRVLIGIALRSRIGFYDAHCHLDFLFEREKFDGTFTDYQKKNRRTFPKNFKGCIATFCKPSTYSDENFWQKYVDHENVWVAFGCHPYDADEFDKAAELVLHTMLWDSKVRALGEIGLDYSTRY